MDLLVENFHVDIKLLIAQFINFGIVLFVLTFFAVKPIIKKLNERTKTIEDSLENAEKIEKQKRDMDRDYTKMVADAKKEAQRVIEKAQQEGVQVSEKMKGKAMKEIEAIVAQSKKQIKVDQEKMIQDAKKDVADLVIEASQKVLGSGIVLDIDGKLIKKTLKEIK